MTRGVQSPHPHAYPPIENERTRSRSGDSYLPLFCAALTANVGGWVIGTAIGWTGPALSLIINDGNVTDEPEDAKNHEFPVSTSDGNFIASLYPVGALVGGMLGGTLISKLGRKFSMFIITVLFAVGYLLLAAAFNRWMLFGGRLVTGFGTGITTIAVPVYVSEIASPDVRGMLGSFFQVMVTIGVLYVDIVGAFVNWRWISVACVGLTLIWSVMLMFIPESPVFFLSQRDFDGARDSLQRLRGHEFVETELSEMQESNDQNLGRKASLIDLTEPQNLKPFLICLLLMFGQQFSGINAVIFFSVSIFEAAKTSLNSFVESIIVAGTQVGATCFAAVFIDRLGRRFLIHFSAIGMIISIFSLGAYFWVQQTDPDEATKITFLPVASLSIYILAFSVGFGPIPWLMMSEIFPPEIKTLASSIAATFNWTLCFVVAQGFGPLTKAVGTAAVFWGFGSILIVVFILCAIFVPETKGKSLDEIQELFRRRRSLTDDETRIIDNAVDDIEEEIQRESNIVSA